MTNKKKTFQRLLSVLLCLTLLVAYFPASVLKADAAVRATTNDGRVTDPGTAYTWESIMGTSADGNRYAGRVWADKSVYENGDTATLNTQKDASGNPMPGSTFQVNLQDGEDFQIIYSVLGSSMTTTTTTSSTGPMDVVLILDTSTSMDDTDENDVTRLERVITAANKLITDLNQIPNVRFAVVTYNADSEQVIPLAQYNNGLKLVVTNYFNNKQANAGVVFAYDNNNTLLGKDSGYTMGTNLQAGIDRGFNILANATDITNRKPVAIVLTDGEANRAVNNDYHTPTSSNVQGGSISAGLALSTLLNAAYTKTKAEKNYGKDVTVYGVSVDMDPEAESHVLMNPGSAENGFNGSNDSSDITSAYDKFVEWKATTNDVTIGGSNNNNGGWRPGGNNGSTTWTFDHNWPASPAITTAEIAENINYVDSHYDVSSDSLSIAFDQIYEELSSSAFNPISTTQTSDGATGVEDTPLVYVDKIGQYMEIKNIQAITLFGASYNVTKGIPDNGVTIYTVEEKTGVNPTTNEPWNTAEDIRIKVTETSGVQTLRVEIDQEILPILLEQVSDKTTGNTHTITLNEITYNPLRVYYTVGLDSDILLPNGQIDVSKIDQNKVKVDGNKITFYANAFGEENPAVGGVVANGDAHVGFHPSNDNRYYYYQDHHEIFSSATLATSVNGSNAITWEQDEYGVVYQEGKYDLQLMTAEEYFSTPANKQVYTYVTFYRPTPSTSDAATAAEKVTYLVYTDWEYMKGSVAFWDKTANAYLNDGKVIPGGDDAVQAAIDTYKAANPNAEIYAVLAEDSERTSRFHNMIFAKMDENNQQINPTGTAVNRYAPKFTHESANSSNGSHNHGDNTVVVWLGNNGKLTTTVETGIALSKAVTEAIGNANDLYALTVTVDPTTVNTTFTPVVKDASGNELDISRVSYNRADKKLTVKVKAGETVYVTGIPAGTKCKIGEDIPATAKYYNTAATVQEVTIPTLANALGTNSQYVTATVTNAPYKYGDLTIIKDVDLNGHPAPDKLSEKVFTFTVELTGTDVEGKEFEVDATNASSFTGNTVTVQSGKFTVTLKDNESITIKDLPAGTTYRVTETNETGYEVPTALTGTIDANGDHDAHFINKYTPGTVTPEVTISGTKTVRSTGSGYAGTEQFNFVLEKYDAINQKYDKVGEATHEELSSGEMVYEIKFNTSLGIGEHHFRVMEVAGSTPGMSYDSSRGMFKIVVTDDDADGAPEYKVEDVANTTVTGDSTNGYTVDKDFTNTYEVDKTHVDINIEKVLENTTGADISLDSFKFALVNVSDSTDKQTITTDATGKATVRIPVDRAHDASSPQKYKLTEDIPDNQKPGMTYDPTIYNISITATEVIENGVTKLVATTTVTKNNETTNVGETVRFENKYELSETSFTLGGTKVWEDNRLPGTGNYEYELYETDSSFDETAATLVEFVTKKEGVFSFSPITKNQVGTYYYVIKEKNTNQPAVEYDTTHYHVTVTVGVGDSDNDNDSDRDDLVVESVAINKIGVNSDTTGKVVFVNKYDPTPVEYTLDGQKTLSGRAMKEGEFEFKFEMDLSSGNANNIDLPGNATNDVYGNFKFDPITFKEPGNYTVKVSEVDGSLPGVVYDSDVIEVTFEVGFDTDNRSLKVTNVVEVEAIAIAFQNTYTTKPAQVIINGKKELKGGALAENDFSFRLYGTDHTFELKEENLVASKTNAADGSFSFTGDFNTTGTYFFALVEDASNPKDGIVYDRAQHNFRVRVSDIGDGYLHVDVTNMDTNETTHGALINGEYVVSAKADFTNATFDEVTKKEVYLEGNTTTMIDGQKVEAGEILTYFLTYKNYHGEPVRVDILDAIPNHTSYVEGSASHEGTYAAGHVNWVLDVAPGAEVEVSFQVKVNETAAIVANTAMIVDGVNTYHTNEVVNHTFDEDEVAEKKVFYPADVMTNIDGKKVYAGEELVYTITYTNASGNPVTDVVITDTIPKHTTYLENSADHDGVYSDGALTWNIDEVPAWSKVTVAFMVKVDENVEVETITNKAIVKEGNNTYKTNEITNYTVEDEVEKKVALVGQETVNIDGKKVYAGDELVYTIRYKNTARDLAAVVITDTIPEHTTYVDGSADNNGVYTEGVITWNLEVAAGAEVVVSFKVKVKDAGNVNLVNKAEVKEGKNTYTTNSVTNYTVDDDVKKEVFTASKTDVSLDGKKVTPGEELVYKIYYKNGSSEKAIVTITDKISEYTAYVEGSADNNGVYKDGVITWNLEVAAGETVAVSFKATVKDVPGAKVANTATIVEGKNSYSTNEVVNQIPAAPATPDNSDLPQTGGNARLGMWTALLVLGCSGLIVTTVYNKKRNESEE